MKRSMSKSLLSLTVTVSVVLSLGMACFDSSTANCDTIESGDVIEENHYDLFLLPGTSPLDEDTEAY